MVDGIKDLKNDGDDISVSDNSDDENLGQMEKMRALAEFIQLPPNIKRRVKALKNLMLQSIKIEAEFYKEVYEVEKKYEERHAETRNKRSAIVQGTVEPTDEDCEWPYDEELQLAETLSKQQIEGDKDVKIEEVSDEKGIPKFWLKVLMHNELTAAMVTDNDQPILEHLDDIKVHLSTEDAETGFTLEFHFSPNDFFTNTVLTKRYVFRDEPIAESPLEYDGPEIIRCRGCQINWKQGKNVTIKVMKKVKKHKNSKQMRTITKTVKRDSFFNFFDPPVDSLTEDTIDEDTAELLQEDFRIGHFMRDSIIPRAVLYFTGEAVDSDDESDEDEDDDDDDIDDDDMDGDESDHNRSKKGSRGGRPGKTGDSEKPPECQQS